MRREGFWEKKVELIVEDSEYKPDVAVRKTTKLILEDKVDILTGSLGSHIILAMMNVADKYNKVFVVDNSEASSITGKDFKPCVFRTTLSTDQRMGATIAYLSKYTNYKKFYILCMDFSYGREAAEALKNNLKKIPGAQLLGEDYHPIALKDFAPYVSKIIASGAEVILTANYGMDLANLIKTEAALGCKAITAGGILFDPVIMQEVREAALGHVVVFHTVIDMGNPVEKKFVKDFQEKHPDLDKVAFSPCYGILSYSTTRLLGEVIKKAGSTDTEKIVKNLGRNDIGYVLGQSNYESL